MGRIRGVRIMKLLTSSRGLHEEARGERKINSKVVGMVTQSPNTNKGTKRANISGCNTICTCPGRIK